MSQKSGVNWKPSAAVCLLRGVAQLKGPSIRGLVLVPLAINVVVYAAALWVGVHYFGLFLQSFLPNWLGILRWVLWPVFGLVFLFLVAFTFTMLANILGAPFYGVLAERLLQAERIEAASSRGGLARSAALAMWVEARRVAGYLLRAVPFLILFLIPGLNVAAPFLWLAFGAWFLAQDYFSYPFDALGLSYAEQNAMLRAMPADRLLFGGLVHLGLTLPLLNILVSPAAVAGATLCVIGRLKSAEPPPAASRQSHPIPSRGSERRG